MPLLELLQKCGGGDLLKELAEAIKTLATKLPQHRFQFDDVQAAAGSD